MTSVTHYDVHGQIFAQTSHVLTLDVNRVVVGNSTRFRCVLPFISRQSTDGRGPMVLPLVNSFTCESSEYIRTISHVISPVSTIVQPE